MKVSEMAKPTWSLYDGQTTIEQDLFVSSIVEFTDISGILCNYYVRNTDSITMDTLYGESTNTEYKWKSSTKIIYEVTEEASITNSFGIVSEDVIQYAMIPVFTFSRDISGATEPRPGDVLTTIWNERSYEVVDVGQEAKIFQLGKFIWELILKPYRFSEQSESAKTPLSIAADSLLTDPITTYGDNTFIEEQSDLIDDLSDVDTNIYGM